MTILYRGAGCQDRGAGDGEEELRRVRDLRKDPGGRDGERAADGAAEDPEAIQEEHSHHGEVQRADGYV